MAKFLNTSGTTYHLEELIKGARERLFLISPFLRLNDKVKELLEDKNRMKIDIRVVYGKNELRADEVKWLSGLTYVRTSYCKNLHAKFYANEDACIVTSLNLYEFSQVNNNEMGVLITRDEDAQLYRDAYEEAQRIIRISKEEAAAHEAAGEPESAVEDEEPVGKLPSSKLAQKLKMRNTNELLDKLVSIGHLERQGDKLRLTESGKLAGGEFRFSKKHGAYFLWPEQLGV